MLATISNDNYGQHKLEISSQSGSGVFMSIEIEKLFYEGWSLKMKYFIAYDISAVMIPIKDVWSVVCNQYQTKKNVFPMKI